MLADVKKDDFVFIQFGHNDTSTKPERHASPEEYAQNLSRFIAQVREKGGHPVLLSSVAMCTFDEEGNLENRRLKNYPQLLCQVARDEKVPLIDIHQKTSEWLQRIGEQKARKYYMNVLPGEDPSYPNGREDDTHMREMGALQVAAMVAEGIRTEKIRPLSRFLSDRIVIASDNFASELSMDKWVLESEVPMDTLCHIYHRCHPIVGNTDLNLKTIWAIAENEEMHLLAPKGASLWYNRRFQENIRIRYQVCMVSDNCPYDRIGNMSCYWMASDPLHPFDFFFSSKQRGGKAENDYALNLYYMGYGEHRNSATRFRRYASDTMYVEGKSPRPAILQGYTKKRYLLKPNHWYSVIIEIHNGNIRYYCDNRLLMNYTDPHPYTEGYFGFRAEESHVAYRNFSVEYIP